MADNDITGVVRFFAPIDADTGESRVEKRKDRFSGTDFVSRLGGMQMDGAAGTTGLLFITVTGTGENGAAVEAFNDGDMKRVSGMLFNAGSGRGGMRLGLLVDEILGDAEAVPDVEGEFVDGALDE